MKNNNNSNNTKGDNSMRDDNIKFGEIYAKKILRSEENRINELIKVIKPKNMLELAIILGRYTNMYLIHEPDSIEKMRMENNSTICFSSSHKLYAETLDFLEDGGFGLKIFEVIPLELDIFIDKPKYRKKRDFWDWKINCAEVMINLDKNYYEEKYANLTRAEVLYAKDSIYLFYGSQVKEHYINDIKIFEDSDKQ